MPDYYKVDGPHFNIAVTGEGTKITDVTDEVAALRAERDEAVAHAREMENKFIARDLAATLAEAEVERMRPIVDAAEAVTDDPRFLGSRLTASAHRVIRAVDAYRATSEQETTDESGCIMTALERSLRDAIRKPEADDA